MTHHSTTSASNRKVTAPRVRRGVALLMALFALGVAATAGTAFVKSRDHSVDVGRSMGQAARARLAAAEGLAISREVLAAIFCQPDAIVAAQWRAQLADGTLLTNYQINGATLNVTVADLTTGAPPTITTTEFQANITVTVGETSYSMSAQMSLQSLIKGQYAIFANKLFRMDDDNFVGRWEKSPKASQKYPINLGTQAQRTWWGNEGAYFDTDAYFEDQAVAISGTYVNLAAAIAATPTQFTRASRAGYAGTTILGEPKVYKFLIGANPLLSASWELTNDFATNQAYLYYPNNAETATVTGGSAEEVELVRMTAGASIAMPTPPNEPSFVPGTTYTGNKTYSGQTLTLNPIRVKCNEFFGIPFGGGDLKITNNSVITLKSGVYRVDDKFTLSNSKLIIDGNVKIVSKARMWFDLDAKSLELSNSSIELKENSQLLLFVAYDLVMNGSWIGKQYTCPSEPNPALAAGDPHRKKWMNQWVANACSTFAPEEPQYIEPWRIRIYPDPAFLSSIFIWDFASTCVVGSIYMPTNPVVLRGTTEIYGRIAANHVLLRDTASFFYDHALDDITGMTEGSPPPRGGTQQIPTRIQIDF
ncbi:MAG: hypothetical protein EXS01_01020 [Phycisphaerales bacterium]|nr:hypothetical protein [Phycisphaerales bacterium]